MLLLSVAPFCGAEPCRSDLRPAEVKQTLEQRFRDWRPKRFSGLISYDQKLWLESHPKECPGIAMGHFERADSLAYALLLVPKSGHTSSYKIVVFSKTSGEYSVQMLDHGEDTGALSLVICKVPPGAYSDFEDTQTLQLKLDALSVE